MRAYEITVKYFLFCLYDLIERIVKARDRYALDEFHHRPIFLLASGKRVVFVEFVNILRECALDDGLGRRYGFAVVEKACDQLVDRFLNLPDEGRVGGSRYAGGIDCCNYFQAFLNLADRECQVKRDWTSPEREASAACLMQRFVGMQFWRRCILDSIRTHKSTYSSRYILSVNGDRYTLWFPRTVSKEERRSFLERALERVNGGGKLDCDEIQSLIDARFGVPGVIPIDELRCLNGRTDGNVPQFCPLSFDEGNGLSPLKIVALEKAASINLQRRAIQKLGRDRCGDFVSDILENLVFPTMDDAELAAKYGLSCPTYSRFAGRNWREAWASDGDEEGKETSEEDGEQRVPDLYRNIAHLAARTPRFVEAAKQTGVWETIEDIRKSSGKVRMRSVNDEE